VESREDSRETERETEKRERGRERERERSTKGATSSSLLEGIDTRLIPAFVNAFLIDTLGTFPLPAIRSCNRPKLPRIRRLALIFDYIRPV